MYFLVLFVFKRVWFCWYSGKPSGIDTQWCGRKSRKLVHFQVELWNRSCSKVDCSWFAALISDKRRFDVGDGMMLVTVFHTRICYTRYDCLSIITFFYLKNTILKKCLVFTKLYLILLFAVFLQSGVKCDCEKNRLVFAKRYFLWFIFSNFGLIRIFSNVKKILSVKVF